MFHAKNRTVAVGDATMDYVSFGSGQRPLVLLPGLGEALQSMNGTALAFALLYRVFAKGYTVYAFGRKRPLPEGTSILDMAEDQAQAMHNLGITGACVVGVSQGGMIAMELAAAHPQLVAGLVLANTTPYCNATLQQALEAWVHLANSNNCKGLMYDMGERVYTKKKFKQYRPWYPLLAVMAKPKSFGRFLIQADACRRHDARETIGKIQCPTLVIGGDCDNVVGKDAALKLAEQIPHCQLLVCAGYGHSAYEEYPSFNSKVLEFFRTRV